MSRVNKIEAKVRNFSHKVMVECGCPTWFRHSKRGVPFRVSFHCVTSGNLVSGRYGIG